MGELIGVVGFRRGTHEIPLRNISCRYGLDLGQLPHAAAGGRHSSDKSYEAKEQRVFGGALDANLPHLKLLVTLRLVPRKSRSGPG